MQMQKGFSLVEMAVALVVVGLATGAVVEGEQMYHNSRLTATAVEVQAYTLATGSFIKQYDALPGDMPNAVTRLPGCVSGGCANGNGNGNGAVGRGDLDIYQSSPLGSGEEDETTLFWSHLAAANFITGVNPNAPMAPGTPWGVSQPAAPAGGGYMVRTMGGLCVNGYSMTGLFIRWQKQPWQDANAGNIFAVSPADAWKIDKKFDDGSPLSGKIQARGTNVPDLSTADGCRASQTDYLNTTDAACYMYFKIRDTSGQ